MMITGSQKNRRSKPFPFFYKEREDMVHALWCYDDDDDDNENDAAAATEKC